MYISSYSGFLSFLVFAVFFLKNVHSVKVFVALAIHHSLTNSRVGSKLVALKGPKPT